MWEAVLPPQFLIGLTEVEGRFPSNHFIAEDSNAPKVRYLQGFDSQNFTKELNKLNERPQ